VSNVPGTFEEAARRVAAMEATMAGQLNAYEDETSTASIKAAVIESIAEHEEPDQTLGAVENMPRMNAIKKQEDDFFREMGLPQPEDMPLDPKECEKDGMWWGDMTAMVLMPQAPKPIEEGYECRGTVYAHHDLKAVYQAFKFANATGEAQMVGLDNGSFLMSAELGTHQDQWILRDTVRERTYVQQDLRLIPSGVGEEIDRDEDIVVWVLPFDDELEGLGYIHNQWVFTR